MSGFVVDAMAAGVLAVGLFFVRRFFYWLLDRLKGEDS